MEKTTCILPDIGTLKIKCFASGIVTRDVAIEKILDEYYEERIKDIQREDSGVSLKEKIQRSTLRERKLRAKS
jgi:hypothetical protein